MSVLVYKHYAFHKNDYINILAEKLLELISTFSTNLTSKNQ